MRKRIHAALACTLVACSPMARDYPDDAGLSLSSLHDICAGGPRGATVKLAPYGIDSQTGHVVSASRSIFFYVGYGIQLEDDPRPRHRTDLPGLSHAAARVHRWEGRETAAIVVEGLTDRHGSPANVWYQYEPGEDGSRKLAEGLAAHTTYCRERKESHKRAAGQ